MGSIFARFIHLLLNKDIATMILPKRNSLVEQIVNNSILREFMNGKQSKEFVMLNGKNYGFKNEFAVFSKTFATDKPLLYTEFGVFKGNSLILAMKNNNNPQSVFIGFDTFTGLPEDYVRGFNKGYFSTSGNMPNIPDKRVRFVKGLFQKELKPILNEIKLLNENRQLFIHMDADLFSSTLYVLVTLDDLIKDGVYIRFDEFGQLSDNSEFLAFRSYLRAFQKDFEIIMADKWYRHVVVRIVELSKLQNTTSSKPNPTEVSHE